MNINLDFEPRKIYRNLSYEALREHEIKNHEGEVTTLGAYTVDTGKFTGRSPKDKFFTPTDDLWVGPVNQEVSLSTWDTLKQRALTHYEGKDIYISDCYAGAVNNDNRLQVRVISEIAWQSHFCKNMFIRPDETELEDFSPEFTIINACKISADDYKELGLNSPVFVIFNLEEKMAIIGGTWYGGEMKKGIFSVMHYLLPQKGVLSMHCSANMDSEGHTALFFGLSGTGKTTLSTDPKRQLIGDDEHGWDDEGVFNFEGGCYAKTISLNPEYEPDIYAAIRPNALLENVVLNDDKSIDFNDSSKTKNTRVSYPIEHIDNRVRPISRGNHPEVVIYLCCDAFGVMPPVSRLNREQAMEYFIAGYTAKVAGTELGINEPKPDFSPCFGGPFLTLHPRRYADLLGKKLDQHDSRVYLVNTGWVGGPYGIGKRISLPLTRKIIDAILDGSIENNDYFTDKSFDLEIPNAIEGVPNEIIHPELAWDNVQHYREEAAKLAELFKENHDKY